MQDLSDIYHIRDLILKHFRHELDADEHVQLQKWIGSSPTKEQFLLEFTDDEKLLQNLIEWRDTGTWKESIQRKIDDRFRDERRVVRLRWLKIAVAASTILVAGLLTFWMVARQKSDKKPLPSTSVANISKNDVAPGGFKARLTLANGSTVVLDSADNRIIGKQGSTVVKSKDGQLIYEQKGKQNEILFNTLSTAKGETYATILSDGSKVWLNSESSVRYPVAFSGDVRKVEITGEAYFEVAPSVVSLENGQKDKISFIVDASGVEVEVLGTHFNINSYIDEDEVKTTLLEGRVKVHSKTNNAIAILQPGQQAKLDKHLQELNKLDEVDVDAEVAWHYGRFQFSSASLQAVLRQLSRWYDVDVVYQGNIPQRSFSGKISMTDRLAQVLKTLESNDVHFRIEGKNIIVFP